MSFARLAAAIATLLTVNASQAQAPIANLDFESGSLGAPPAGWRVSPGTTFVTTENAQAGRQWRDQSFCTAWGYNVTWTGIQVTKQDGGQLHGVGLAPDYPVRRTLAGCAPDGMGFWKKVSKSP